MSQFEVREDGLLSERPVADLAAWYSRYCPETAPLAFEAQFMIMAAGASLKLDSPFEPRANLTRARYDVLRVLAQTDDSRLQMTDIVQAMNVSPTSITKLVDQLVKAGYVRRAPDPADKRKFWVELLPAGRMAFEEAMPDVGGHVQAFWEGLSEQEMRMLIHLLARVRMNVLTSGKFARHSQALLSPSSSTGGDAEKAPVGSY